MPTVANQGVRIHYEVAGEGPPLVLQHGFTDSLLGWYERGYVDAVIAPRDTRSAVTSALAVLRDKRRTLPPRKHGNIPL